MGVLGNCLRFARPAEARPREKSSFPSIFKEKIAKTLIFEVPRSSGFTLSGLELGKPKFDPFRPKTLFFQPFFEGFRRFPKVSEGF